MLLSKCDMCGSKKSKSKFYLEEQLLIKYCVIKNLVLLKIQNMTDIKGIFNDL